MSNYKIIDTPWHTQSKLSCLKSEGIEIVIRYYNNGNTEGLPQKRLELNEAQALSHSGFQLMVVFQRTNNTAEYFSFDQGLADGKHAFLWASETIGQPFGSAIYFAVDYDATRADLTSNIIPYFEGVQQAFKDHTEGSNTYLVGVYGSGLVTKTLKEKGLITYRWLSESTGFYGTRQAIENGEYELYQKYTSVQNVCGIDADYDVQNPNGGGMGAFTLQPSA